MTTIVPDLVADGFVVAEVEYRRRDDEGGGWPGSNEDVLAALNFLPSISDDIGLQFDLSKVILIGHSAGGTMVLWAAAHAEQILPALVVAVAPIADLEEGYRQRSFRFPSFLLPLPIL
jgi:acetyl esterase/lipase